MMTYMFKFVVPSKNLTVTLHKGDDGTWIVGKQILGQWRNVCATELFEYAKHAFDVEVAKAENEIRYEMEGC